MTATVAELLPQSRHSSAATWQVALVSGMIGHMRHMGNSGKLALIAAAVALLMLVLTALTLAEPVMFTFLGLVALAYVAALFEVLSRGRNAIAVVAGVGTSLTLAFSLAFVSTWELAFAEQSSFLGTPLPTGDPDNYFYLSAGSAMTTLLVLFLGAVWPASRRPGTPKAAGTNRKPSPVRRRPASPARRTAGGTAAQRPAAQRSSAQGASGSRAPARLPAPEAKRPPSSPARRPVPKPAAKSFPRR